MKPIDITGQKFDKLTVLYRNRERGSGWWTCVCECGKTCDRGTSYLRLSAAYKSCGCMHSQIMKQVCTRPDVKARLLKNATTHGMSDTPEYVSWQGMKARCYSPVSASWVNYGARGIKVCDAWRNDFMAFLRDMGPKPEPSYSLDRKDPNGDYEPENCQWVTMAQQGEANKRDVYPITVKGIWFPSHAAACRHFGVLQPTVERRMRKGVPIDAAFSHGRKVRNTPVMAESHSVEHSPTDGPTPG